MRDINIEGLFYQKLTQTPSECMNNLDAFMLNLEDFVPKSHDFIPFVVGEIRIMRMRIDTVLPGHFHNNRELCFLLAGDGFIKLVDPKNKYSNLLPLEKKIVIIPPNIAHTFTLDSKAILLRVLECASSLTDGKEHPYEIKISDE